MKHAGHPKADVYQVKMILLDAQSQSPEHQGDLKLIDIPVGV